MHLGLRIGEELEEAARRVHEVGLATLLLRLEEYHRKPTQVAQDGA